MPIIMPFSYMTPVAAAASGVTTRALEQWFAADYGVTVTSGLVTAITSRNGTYTLSGSGSSVCPVMGTDSGGFSYFNFASVSLQMAMSQSIKAAGIEIANGAEWHGVLAWPDSTTRYVMTLEEAQAEGRNRFRVYRGASNNLTVFPEPGGAGASPSITATYGTNKAIFSAYRDNTTNTIAVGINGAYVTGTSSGTTPLARGEFRWHWPQGTSPKCYVYESLGYVDNLTTTERAATINALKSKYGIA